LTALQTALDEIFSDPKLKALAIDVRINFGGDDPYGLARKIHDFRSTKGLAMVQIRCLVRFETKSEAFACPNIPQQTVSFFQIFLIDRWSRSLINGRAVPMAERFC
jgi:hypothetical protein